MVQCLHSICQMYCKITWVVALDFFPQWLAVYGNLQYFNTVQPRFLFVEFSIFGFFDGYFNVENFLVMSLYNVTTQSIKSALWCSFQTCTRPEVQCFVGLNLAIIYIRAGESRHREVGLVLPSCTNWLWIFDLYNYFCWLKYTSSCT